MGTKVSEQEMETRKIFAKRIKDLREENGFGVRETAAKIGISHSSLLNYEGCERTPDIAVLRAFTKLFNVKGDYLLGITDVKR
jgi:transcriptional regulator with XRE-family HTH domain